MNKQEIFAAISAKEIEFLDSLSHQESERITRASLADCTCVCISDQAIVFQAQDGSRRVITLGMMGKNYPSRTHVSVNFSRSLHFYYVELCNFSTEDLQLAQDLEEEYYSFLDIEKAKEERYRLYIQLKNQFENV